jgi:hypothetical protein
MLTSFDEFALSVLMTVFLLLILFRREIKGGWLRRKGKTSGRAELEDIVAEYRKGKTDPPEN